MTKSEIYSFLDLTSLSSIDNINSIAELVKFAIDKEEKGFKPAALCVFPQFYKSLQEGLLKSQIRSAVVAGAFPHGLASLETKVFEVKQLADNGIDEIDIVINRGLILAEEFDQAQKELEAIRQACPNVCLKVILETGELQSEKLIKHATQTAINAQADFVKTSTGKSTIGATPEAVHWMCEVVKEHHQKTGNQVGIKVSGGVKTEQEARDYISIVQNILGDSWLSPSLFRIGASSLANELIKDL